jgi:polar amino acid transport system substrate-binding protein
MKKAMLCIFGLLLVAAGGALAEELPVITFATDATWPPMEFVDANKNVTGFSIEYVTRAGREAGFTPKFVAVAWDGIFAGLDVGKYDAIVSSVSITEKRKKAMDFSEPYFQVRQALIVPKDSPVTSLAELKGKEVGSQISTTGTFAIKEVPGVIAKTYDEVGLAVEDLHNGRIAGVVCDDPVAANYVLQNEKYAKTLKIAAVMQSKEAEFYGIAVKKGNQQVLDLVNKGIAALKAKGTDVKLRDKWIGGN